MGSIRDAETRVAELQHRPGGLGDHPQQRDDPDRSADPGAIATFFCIAATLAYPTHPAMAPLAPTKLVEPRASTIWAKTPTKPETKKTSNSRHGPLPSSTSGPTAAKKTMFPSKWMVFAWTKRLVTPATRLAGRDKRPEHLSQPG